MARRVGGSCRIKGSVHLNDSGTSSEATRPGRVS